MGETTVDWCALSSTQRRRAVERDGRSACHVVCAVRIDGPLDVERLSDAMRRSAARHEMLRTRLERRPGSKDPVQVIGEVPAFPLIVCDGAGMAAEGVRLSRLGEDSWRLVLRLPATHADVPSAIALVRELCAEYAGRAPGEPAFQFAEFTAYEAGLLESEAGSAGLQRWRSVLAAVAPSRPPFPAGSDDAAAGSTPGTIRVVLEEELASAWRGLRHGGCTTDVALAAVWSVLMCRLTGSTSFCVGVADDCREYAEFDELIGPLEKTLPVAGTLRRDDTWAALFERMAALVEEARAWRSTYVAEDAWPSGDDGCAGDLPVSFAFYDTSCELNAGEIVFSIEHLTRRVEASALQLVAVRSASGLALELDFDPAAIGETGARRILTCLVELMRAAVRDRHTRALSVPLLSASERRSLMRQGRGPGAVVDAGFVARSIARHAAGRGTSVAVRAADATIDHARLDARADRVGQCLRAAGVGPETPVGVYLEPGIDLVVALLGVWRAEGAYVPLDVDAPAARLGMVMEDARLAMVVTRAGLADRVRAAGGVRILEIDGLETHESGPADAPRAPAGDQLAYVLYTSGSTGRPKGVMVTHAGLANYVAWAMNAYDATQVETAPLHTNVSFDLSVTSLWVPLAAGRTVEVVEPATSIEWLAARLAQDAPALVKLTPGHLRGVRELLRARGQRSGPATLVVGGEALGGGDVGEWIGDGVRVVNEYGPTETVVGCCVADVGADDAAATIVPIGRPIAETRLCVVDEAGQMAPVGVEGELLIGGAGVARGYLNRPDLTAERFVPDPWGAPGARVYRSGDRVRWREDGQLEYLGRLDTQVKIRGYRVEPGEVEQVLRTHADVADAAVVVRETGGPAQLVGYACARAGAVVEDAGLRRWLSERLPEYLVPPRVVVLEALPLSANGKVDRAALQRAALPAAAGRAPGSGRAPATAAEATLVAVWEEVLRRSPVGVEDNFFALGGDSILSIQVVARATQRGVVITPRDVFEHQTIAALAAAAQGRAAAPAEQGAVTGPVALTPIQRWFFARAVTPRSHFNQSVVLQARAPLALAALAAAVAAVQRQHDALRLRFAETATGWQQWHDPDDRHQVVGAVDLTDVPAAAQGRVWLAVVERLQGSLALGTGPLMRVAAVRLGGVAGERVVLVVHHLVVDGVSWRVLLEDLNRGYGQAVQGVAVTLGPKTTAWQTGAQVTLDPKTTASQTGAAVTLGPKTTASQTGAAVTLDPKTTASQTGAAVTLGPTTTASQTGAAVTLDPKTTAWQTGAPVTLGPKTTAWQTWAAGLAGLAMRPALDAERAYWTAVYAGASLGPAAAAGAVGAARRVAVTLDAGRTKALVAGVAQRWGGGTEAALLAAVGEALRGWTGAAAHVVEVEGHGRQPEAVSEGLDLSRTVGWFTTVYPVRVTGRALTGRAPTGEAPTGEALTGEALTGLALTGLAATGEALTGLADAGWAAAVQHQHAALQALPHKGLGYGVLRWGEAADAAPAWPAAHVGVNYLGQWDQTLPADAHFVAAAEPTGANCSLSAERARPIEITAQVWQDQLRIQIAYPPSLESEIQQFAGALRAALEQIADEAASETHSLAGEFPLARLDTQELQAVLGMVGEAR